MKRLYLIRHAKSSWDNPNLSDFERPLNERGRAAARNMSAWFAREASPTPQKLIASPATRAMQTAERFAEALKINPQAIEQDPRIYDAALNTLVQVVEGLPNATDSIVLFGHNPGFSELADFLLHEYSGSVPTCAVTALDVLSTHWKDVRTAEVRLVLRMTPKQLAARCEMSNKDNESWNQ